MFLKEWAQHLRDLVAGSKVQGQSISGKGKLTAAKMLKIQNHYGRAIKDYAHDEDLLKKRIFPILFHMSSSSFGSEQQPGQRTLGATKSTKRCLQYCKEACANIQRACR